MLLQFNVKNYMSFKEEQVFTTLANTDISFAERNLVSYKKKKYSKINVMYGANASGKSNFCKALNFIKSFFLNSNNMLESTPIFVDSFRFDDDNALAPSEFNIIFVKDELKYSYSFSCNRTEVLTERLDMYENDKPSLVFKRNKSDYRFTSFAPALSPISDRNTKNKLFVCTAATWNFKEAKPVVDYIVNDMIVSFDYNYDIYNILESFKAKRLYDEYKKFCLSLLVACDFSISNFDINIKESAVSPELKMLINALSKLPNVSLGDKLRTIKFTTSHKIQDGNTKKEYPLELEFESLGTQAVFMFAPLLFDVFKNGKTLIVDEIDKSLHPLLVNFIVSLFVNGDINKTNAQLICNTHDTNLLSLDLFRRDEIWFTERNPNTGASELYPLTDFSPNKKANIEKGYLIGRYGAIPFIKDTCNLWE
ncbi:MAG: ATP-binding protein [Clostridia bacterium]